MIEAEVLQYLSGALDVPVFMEQPEERPEFFVIVEKTGSGRVNKVNRATFALQSYAPTMYLAAELNESVKAAMDAMVQIDHISRSALNSDYNYTDTADKHYRYQAVYDIIY